MLLFLTDFLNFADSTQSEESANYALQYVMALKVLLNPKAIAKLQIFPKIKRSLFSDERIVEGIPPKEIEYYLKDKRFFVILQYEQCRILHPLGKIGF